MLRRLIKFGAFKKQNLPAVIDEQGKEQYARSNIVFDILFDYLAILRQMEYTGLCWGFSRPLFQD